MLKKKIFVVLLNACLLLSFTSPAQAQASGASLSVGSASGMPGDSGISVPVRLNSNEGTEITGLNFDLTFDSNRLMVQNVIIGSNASSAGKTLSWSSPSSGRIRVIIFGLNLTAIPSGTLADVTFSVNAGAVPGTSSLSLSSATATDQGGISVPLSLSSGTFTVNAHPPATATATAQPKTLPTSTATKTHTPRPSATMTKTATAQPVNTSNPTNTQAAVAATATRTPTQASTLTSGTTLQPTPTGITTSTTTAPLFSSPTPTLGGGDDLENSATEIPQALGSTPVADSLELAVVATSTALAEKAISTKGSNDSVVNLDESTNSGEVLTNRLTDILYNNALIAPLFLGTGIISALFVPPIAIYMYRNRTTFPKRSKKAQSHHSSGGDDQHTNHWNNR